MGWDLDEPSALKLVDTETLEVRTVKVPMEMPEFVVPDEGSELLVSSAWSGGPLVIYDIDHDASVVLPVQGSLTTHTVRGSEVWVVADGLVDVDLESAEVRRVSLPFTPGHVVWSPGPDLLFVDDATRPEVHFIDPDDGYVYATYTIVP